MNSTRFFCAPRHMRATPVSGQRNDACIMAATRLLLPALLLLPELCLVKSEFDSENFTVKAENFTGETPVSVTYPRGIPEVQTVESLGSRADTLTVCPCDLHPGFCDLNCCCDLKCGSECNLGVSGCPFSCLPGSTRAVSWVCLEEFLIFRNSTPFQTAILPGPDGCALLFCVQLNDSKLNYLQVPQVVTEVNFPVLSAQYGGSSFIPLQQVWSSPTVFYRVGDPIQIYFPASSVLSVLKQPASMGASQLCTDESPAGFLESKSTSCVRIFTDLASSCTSDPALDAVSYYRDFNVLRVPVNVTYFQLFQVHIVPHSVPLSPWLDGSTCHNIVSEVNYDMEVNGIHGIQKVYVEFKVANISGNPGFILQQRFSIHFGSKRPSVTKRRSGNPGYIIGAPLIALYNGSQQHLTILKSQADGQCSATERQTVRFEEHITTGCEFSVPFKPKESDCDILQELLYQAFQGGHSTGRLAIIGSAEAGHLGEWTNIFIKRCKSQDGHCMIPISLEIQVIWAYVGLLSNPQAQILGAQYYYLCKPLKSLDIYMNMLSLTSSAAFTDATKWPEQPRGQADFYWKLPFDFFFPFKMALSGTVCCSGNISVILLMTLMLYEVFVN